MFIKVMTAKFLFNYTIRFHFSDGTIGDVDLQETLYGPVFEPLLDHAKFQDFHIDPEMGTIVWSNGADIAPEWLYEKCRVLA